MSDDIEQLRQDLQICEFVSLQLDESTNVCDASAMAVLRKSC
jgi:hypothetical protein